MRDLTRQVFSDIATGAHPHRDAAQEGRCEGHERKTKQHEKKVCIITAAERCAKVRQKAAGGGWHWRVLMEAVPVALHGQGVYRFASSHILIHINGHRLVMAPV